ncbi:hypothetical protein RY26_23635 [Pseudomonas fluorescens]|nr:hypothetical protein RY26_23635 [Pseudomonas fluorescens]
MRKGDAGISELPLSRGIQKHVQLVLISTVAIVLFVVLTLVRCTVTLVKAIYMYIIELTLAQGMNAIKLIR